MNGVPALRPQFPDYGNVLARGAAIKGQQARNVLTQMQIEGYPEERNWLREQRGHVREDRAIAEKQRLITQEATAFATALKAKNAKTAKQIYNAMKPEGSKDIVDFKMDEKTTSVTYGDGTKVEGPISHITEATEQIAKDPTWVTDPEKTRHFAAWCAARKITFTAGQKEEDKPEKLYYTKDGWQPREKAIGLVKPEKKEKEERLYETEKGLLPRDQAVGLGKPSQTYKPERLYETTEGLLPRDQAIGKKKPVKEGGEKAPAKVAKAQTFVLKFVNTINPVVAAIISANPTLANSAYMKENINPKVPTELKKTYDKAVKILEEYYGVPEEDIELPGQNVTHEFIPGKGLVKVE